LHYVRDTIKKIRNNQIGYVYGVLENIPDVLKFDSKKKLFLRYDSSALDNERFIILYSEYKLKYIENIDVLVVEGTFKSCPSNFSQLLVFHGCIFGRSFPFIYILLSSKNESAYTRAINKCRMLLNLNCERIVFDFERGLLNGLKNEFCSGVVFNGCMFHLGEAIWRRIRSMGLATRYKSDNAFRKVIKML
jgi:hypothetical protein